MDAKMITQTLEMLIAFQTIAGNRREKDTCLDWIQSSFLTQAPSGIERGECADCPYILMVHPVASWMWFAHIDVVPGRSDQFSVHVDGDALLGRGVKDMKGAALPFLLAYRDACRESHPPAVSILISTDEETGGKTIPTLLKKGLKTPIAFTPDTGSSPGIVIEHKGAVWLKLSCTGVSGHGAIPWESQNPIVPLCEGLQRIAAAYPPGKASDWQMTVSVTELCGSDARNRIPQEASAILDVRYPPEEISGLHKVLERLRPLLPEACTLHLEEEANPLSTDPSHPFIRTFFDIVERIEGAPPPFIREHGATDARHFCAAGIPAFLYGPKGGGIHGDDEWVSLASLQQQYRIYRELFAAHSN